MQTSLGSGRLVDIGNLGLGSPGREVIEKYRGPLGSTPVVTTAGHQEICPQKGFIPDNAQGSTHVVAGREANTFELEKCQVGVA